MMSAAVATDGAQFDVRAVRRLFDTRLPGTRWTGSPYDVSPDGQRFLVNVWDGQETPTPITLVVNWTAGIRK